MRSTKSLFLAGLFAVVAVAIIGLGCSSDNTTTIVPVEEDNGIEAHLEVVSSQVNEHLDSAVTVIESGLRVATFIDVGTGDIGDSFMGSILSDSTSDDTDWIVSWATDLQAGLGTLSIIDSLTYVVGGAFSVNAKDADAMHVKHNYSYQSSDSTVSHTDVANRGYLHITGINGSTATINGEFSALITDKEVSSGGTVWNEWTIETTVTNLTVPKSGSSWTSGCPATGTAVVSIEHLYAEDTDVPVTTQWDMTVTFTDGETSIAVTTGNLSTSYDNSLCTP